MHYLLLQVFRSPWMIDPSYAQSSHIFIKQLLEGKLVFEGNREDFKPKMFFGSTPLNVKAYNNSAQRGSSRSSVVAVIPVKGVLLKDDQECGPVGMDTIGKFIKQLDADQSVDAIMLNIDSPGGTVSGTAQLGEVIRNTKKPIVAFVDDFTASAAYWLASQCDRIIASTPKSEVGSIGVMLSWADMQPMWEKEGVVFHEIYADGSEKKNQDIKEIRAKKYEGYKERVLNPLLEDFVLAVKQGRGKKIKDEAAFDGHIEFAEDAIKTGLVDQVANFEEAIDITLGLVSNQPISKSEIPKPKIETMTKFARTAAVVGVPSFEVADGGIFLTEDQMTANEAALEKAEGDRIALEQSQAQVQALQGTATQHESTIAERDATIAAQAKEVDTLKQAAGAQPAIVTSKSDLESKEGENPMVAEINATSDTAERIEIMRKHGYGKQTVKN